MNIVFEYPPNYAAILAKFPAAPSLGAFFCYGDKIYNPFRSIITSDKIAHEEVHQAQQGADPAAWWDRYLVDDDFRFEQELEAHRAEYRRAIVGMARPGRRLMLRTIAGYLAGPLYNNMVSTAKAMELLKA